jgi:ABC-2 type transport system ATP-binding protein
MTPIDPAAGTPAVLLANGLVKDFDGTRAVDGVDLRLAAGEVRGVLGPNGAGKTTLLRMLFGLIAPDAGEIELFGHAPAPDDPAALDGTAGFVEGPAFYPYLSGRANLELLARLDDGGAGARIEDALERVALLDRAGDRVSGYSTGMRQRLGIAASLLRAPRLLLLDEPSSGLDPAGVRDVWALVRELAHDGVAVLLSSHQIVEVEGVCDSFTVLRKGRAVWSGTAAQLREHAPAVEYRVTTSDDRTALELARDHAGVRATPAPEGGLRVQAHRPQLDSYVVALGTRGVAVRGLEVAVGPLEAMFFALTGEHAHALIPRETADESLAGNLIGDGG